MIGHRSAYWNSAVGCSVADDTLTDSKGHGRRFGVVILSHDGEVTASGCCLGMMAEGEGREQGC